MDLVVKDVAKALGENEGKNEVLILGRILGPTNGTSGVPNPRFEGFVFGSGSFFSRLLTRHLKTIGTSHIN